MTSQLLDDLHGEILDLDVFYNDAWLKDSAVIDNIKHIDGNWEVSLVFAYIRFPMKLIKRKITTCITRQKAEISAHYMRRLAAKDQRGTLYIDKKYFDLCLN